MSERKHERSSSDEILRLISQANGQPVALNETWTLAQAHGVRGKALSSALRPRGRQLEFQLPRSGGIIWSLTAYDGDQFVVPSISVPTDLKSAHPIAKAAGVSPLRGIAANDKRRTSLIIQGLIAESLQRDYQVRDGGWRRSFLIAKGEFVYGFVVRSLPDDRLEVQAYSNSLKLKSVRDTTTQPVEEKLGHLFHAIDVDTLEAARRSEARKAEEAARAKKSAEEREKAIAALGEARRAEALMIQVDLWERAKRIRAYSGALRGTDRTEKELEWINWMDTYAERIDPVLNEVSSPEPRPFTEEDLRPHLPAPWWQLGLLSRERA